MEFGVAHFSTHDGIGPGPLARLAEEHGFESLFFSEHTHIPVGSERGYPLGDLPRTYLRVLDLFVSMQAALMATTTLRVESSIVQLAQRVAEL